MVTVPPSCFGKGNTAVFLASRENYDFPAAELFPEASLATKTLYVSNLPVAVTSIALEIHFSQYGAANPRVVAGQGFGAIDIEERYLEEVLALNGEMAIDGQFLVIRELAPTGPAGYIGERRVGYAGRNSFTMR